jgi:hypothetical protein
MTLIDTTFPDGKELVYYWRQATNRVTSKQRSSIPSYDGCLATLVVGRVEEKAGITRKSADVGFTVV